MGVCQSHKQEIMDHNYNVTSFLQQDLQQYELRIVSSTTVSELYFYLCAYFIFTWLFGHFGRKVDY